MVAPPDVGNGAECAEPVAAFGYLDVGARPVDRTKDPLGHTGRNVSLEAEDPVDNGNDAILVICVHERRDLGKLLSERSTVAGGYATAHNDWEISALAPLLLRKLERRVERLLRGRDEKRAGVDQRDICLVGVAGLVVSGTKEKCAHAVGVDLVLGAAAGNEENVWHGVTLSVVDVLERLTVVIAAQECDDLLQGIL